MKFENGILSFSRPLVRLDFHVVVWLADITVSLPWHCRVSFVLSRRVGWYLSIMRWRRDRKDWRGQALPPRYVSVLFSQKWFPSYG